MGRVWTVIYTSCICGGLILVIGYSLAWAGVPKAPGSDTSSLFTQANQLKGLIGIVILLFGGNMWWMRQYITQNNAKWKTNWDHHRAYDDLKTRHDVMMEMSGCTPQPKEKKSPTITHYSSEKG